MSQHAHITDNDDMHDPTWRFFVNEHDGNGTPTVYRAKPVQMGDDYGDTWRHYWDGDVTVAVYDDPRYTSPTSGEWTDRTERAIKKHHEYGLRGDSSEDVSSMLTRLARRIVGEWATVGGNWDARFIPVNVDRGVTLYCLSWDGDPEGTWRDEIEAVYHGDIWRFDIEEYDGQRWVQSDSDGEEWYGEHMAYARWIDNYPLDLFPAHLFVSEVGA